MIIELIADSIGSAGLTIAALKTYKYFTGKRFTSESPFSKTGPMFWSWIIFKSSRSDGFYCPKCQAIATTKQPPFCECEEFFEGHFHFECQDCHFKSLMLTHD